MRPIFSLGHAFANQIQTAESEAARVYECVIGLVTDNKDPSKLGRVKVKVPILSDDDTTTWAPIIMLGAGANRGWFFIPEIDDEVLVMFEHGSMDRPIVVGQLWNGKDTAPTKNDGGNNVRMMKSRSGSTIEFHDDGSPKVIIQDGGGKGRITIDASANKITIEALDGDVCMQAPKGVMQIVAKAVTFTAQNQFQLQSGAAMAWGAGSSANINGQSVTLSGATVNINSGMAQMPTAPTAQPQDVPDPFDGGGS